MWRREGTKNVYMYFASKEKGTSVFPTILRYLYCVGIRSFYFPRYDDDLYDDGEQNDPPGLPSSLLPMPPPKLPPP